MARPKSRDQRARTSPSSIFNPRSSGLALPAVLLLGAAASGCVGHLLGLSDGQADRLRRIVAELEIRNAELVEEKIELQRRLGEARAASSGVGEGDTIGGTACRN